MEDKEEVYGDDIIDGSAEYSPKSEFSKPKIVFDASERCMQLRAKEMKRGYFNTTVSKEGLPIRTWIEDSRKSFCSAVTALASLLIPEILEDDAYEKKEKEFKEKNKNEEEEWINPINRIKKEIVECFKKYAYYILEPKKTKTGKRIYIKSDKYFMPEVDAVVSLRKIFPDGSEELIDSPSHWNKYVDTYWNELVVINDKLFEELMRIIHRLNYFKSKGGFGNWSK